MKKTKLTIFSLVFALVLLLGFALCVSAEEADIAADLSEHVETWDISATTNDSVVANLYNDPENEGMYTLVISGSGNIKYWNSSNSVPWWYRSYSSKITNVVIENGVANIGN